jgi:site-specific recombinase XerC
MHRVVKQALGQALRSEMLIRNPADAVDPPKVDWKPMQVYDVPQTAKLIEAVRDTPVLVPTLLAILCGLRRGEICALLAERRSSDRPNLGGRKSSANQDGTAVQVSKERQGPHRAWRC